MNRGSTILAPVESHFAIDADASMSLTALAGLAVPVGELWSGALGEHGCPACQAAAEHVLPHQSATSNDGGMYAALLALHLGARNKGERIRIIIAVKCQCRKLSRSSQRH